MAVIPIDPPPSRRAAPARTAILALGFRPFFLLAGVAAVALVALWMFVWMGRLPVAGAYYGTVGWHGHEMLFGYAAAVIAGFLLTAVRNWTGIDTPTGLPLAALALLWAAGRVVADVGRGRGDDLEAGARRLEGQVFDVDPLDGELAGILVGLGLIGHGWGIRRQRGPG